MLKQKVFEVRLMQLGVARSRQVCIYLGKEKWVWVWDKTLYT